MNSCIRHAYVHVPFCRHRCGYCDFTLVAGRDDLFEDYFTALGIELKRLSQPIELDTLYLGGGTPTHVGPDGVKRLFSEFHDALQPSPAAEVTIEADDDSLALAGTVAIDLNALYNPLVAFDRSTTHHKGLAKKVAAVFGAERVDEVVVARQLCRLTSMGATFSGGTLEVPEHDLVAIDLPRVPGAVTGAELGSHRGARTQPLRVDPATEQVDIVLSLPDGYEVAYAPAEAAIASEIGSFRRTVVAEDGELTVTTLLLIEQSVIAATQWPDLKALIDAVEGDTANTVLLRRADD